MTQNSNTARRSNWRQAFSDTLPVFGHRNWIVLADSAYPAQSRNGIVTLLADDDHLQVLDTLLAGIRQATHVRPNIYLDSELAFVDDADAPGVNAIRTRLRSALAGQPIHELLHEEIIARLDRAAAMFEILIIKTRLTIPYTSVFFELECGYWTEAAERRLRQTMPRP